MAHSTSLTGTDSQMRLVVTKIHRSRRSQSSEKGSPASHHSRTENGQRVTSLMDNVMTQPPQLPASATRSMRTTTKTTNLLETECLTFCSTASEMPDGSWTPRAAEEAAVASAPSSDSEVDYGERRETTIPECVAARGRKRQPAATVRPLGESGCSVPVEVILT